MITLFWTGIAYLSVSVMVFVLTLFMCYKYDVNIMMKEKVVLALFWPLALITFLFLLLAELAYWLETKFNGDNK